MTHLEYEYKQLLDNIVETLKHQDNTSVVEWIESRIQEIEDETENEDLIVS